jgi:hypothetical protein
MKLAGLAAGIGASSSIPGYPVNTICKAPDVMLTEISDCNCCSAPLGYAAAAC